MEPVDLGFQALMLGSAAQIVVVGGQSEQIAEQGVAVRRTPGRDVEVLFEQFVGIEGIEGQTQQSGVDFQRFMAVDQVQFQSPATPEMQGNADQSDERGFGTKRAGGQSEMRKDIAEPVRQLPGAEESAGQGSGVAFRTFAGDREGGQPTQGGEQAGTPGTGFIVPSGAARESGGESSKRPAGVKKRTESRVVPVEQANRGLIEATQRSTQDSSVARESRLRMMA
jgi:hypothetical protein